MKFDFFCAISVLPKMKGAVNSDKQKNSGDLDNNKKGLFEFRPQFFKITLMNQLTHKGSNFGYEKATETLCIRRTQNRSRVVFASEFSGKVLFLTFLMWSLSDNI